MYHGAGESHDVSLRSHPSFQRPLLSVRIQRTMNVSAETLARFLFNTSTRGNWDLNLSDTDDIFTASKGKTLIVI